MMENRRSKINARQMEAEVIIADLRSEIDLEGSELLRLELGQPGTRMMCLSGTLWLTQPDDLHDHLLRAGQAFILDQPGIVLVQGLPCGKARILKMLPEPAYPKNNCSGGWDDPLEAEQLR
jgi:hypothetical protein